MSNRKLTEEQVIEICKKLNERTRLKDLAEEYNVSITNISYIATKKIYKDIGEEYLEERKKASRKLTKEQVIEICKKLNKGVTVRELAEEYSMNCSTLYDLANKDSYIEIGEEYLEETPYHFRRRSHMHPRAKFTKRQVQRLRQLAKNKGYYKLVKKRIAEKYKVQPSTVSKMLNGDTYQNVD